MKRVHVALLFSMILLSLLISGCKWSITSITGPNCAATGQTITIYISGSCQSEEDSPTLYGLILQIPEGWNVLSAIVTTTNGYSYTLTQSAQYATLYAAEPGHKVWVGTSTDPQQSTTDGTATVQLSVGDCTGQARIKAAAGSYRHEIWTTDDPSAEFNFANITEQKYVHLIDCCAWRQQSAPSPPNHLKGVWGSSGSDVFVVGANGTILHYNGQTWSSMTSGTTGDLNGIWGSAANYVFAVGSSGTILHYNGTAWSSMASGTTSKLNGVWGKPGFGVLAVGDNQNTILQYIGDTWLSTTLPGACSSSELFGIWGSAANNIFAVGNFRSFFHYIGSWNCTQLYGGNMYAIWGSSGADVFAVGDYVNEFWEDHPIAHYDGNSWSAMPNDTTNSLYGIWGSSASDVFAVGGNGTILRYDGSSWSSMTSDTTNNLRAVWGSSSSSDIFAVGDDGTILHYGPPIVLYADADEQCGGLTPCYSSIQAAVNAAKNGDGIKVKQGTYKEYPTNTKPVTVTISGGWNDTFTDRTGTTEMYAPGATGGGTLMVQPNIRVVAP